MVARTLPQTSFLDLQGVFACIDACGRYPQDIQTTLRNLFKPRIIKMHYRLRALEKVLANPTYPWPVTSKFGDQIIDVDKILEAPEC